MTHPDQSFTRTTLLSAVLPATGSAFSTSGQREWHSDSVYDLFFVARLAFWPSHTPATITPNVSTH
jgi:hypothetical protein